MNQDIGDGNIYLKGVDGDTEVKINELSHFPAPM